MRENHSIILTLTVMDTENSDGILGFPVLLNVGVLPTEIGYSLPHSSTFMEDEVSTNFRLHTRYDRGLPETGRLDINGDSLRPLCGSSVVENRWGEEIVRYHKMNQYTIVKFNRIPDEDLSFHTG